MAKQHMPVNIERAPAINKRPKRSLANPTAGLPMAVPKLSSAVMLLAWDCVRPIDNAKSEREYNNVMYPSMLMKAYESSIRTSGLLSK